MKVLVTGVAGQLGHDVMDELLHRGHDGVGSDLYITGVILPYFGMDITDESEVHRLMKEISPDAVIHCAAYSGIDKAERDPERAMDVNRNGTRYIADCCREQGIKMLYVSTDYVFGEGEGPWDEDCADFHPVNVYGKTKLEGERAMQAALDECFIVRFAWLYGRNGHNLVKTMLRQAKKQFYAEAPTDQIGIPTSTYDAARLLVDMIESDKYGVYHATNSGTDASLYEVTCQIIKLSGLTAKVKPIDSGGYFGKTDVRVQHNSCLSIRKLEENGFVPLQDWHEALMSFLWGYEGNGGGYAC